MSVFDTFESPGYLVMRDNALLWTKIIVKEGESLKKPVRIGRSDRGPDRRQVGNIATPSNERDRLSYLHCRASINSHGRYTHTRSTRVRIRRCMR